MRTLLFCLVLQTGCSQFGLYGAYQDEHVNITYDNSRTDLDWLLETQLIHSYECRRALYPSANYVVTECERIR